jgi:hypothetical protein
MTMTIATLRTTENVRTGVVRYFMDGKRIGAERMRYLRIAATHVDCFVHSKRGATRSFECCARLPAFALQR